MKYQFLKGIANRRIDDLLKLISAKIQTYYSYLEGLQLAGRLSKVNKSSEDGAQRMLELGFDKRVKMTTTDGIWDVPSDEKCLCIALACLNTYSEPMYSACTADEVCQQPPTCSDEKLLQLTSTDMIRDLFDWSLSEDILDSPTLNCVLEKAHNEAFSTFKVKSWVKLIKLLHPYRKNINKNKRKRNSADHSYDFSCGNSKRPVRCTSQDGDREYEVKTNKRQIDLFEMREDENQTFY